MKYADDKNIPFVIIAGENEIQLQKFTVKNMYNGDQKTVDENTLLNLFIEK